MKTRNRIWVLLLIVVAFSSDLKGLEMDYNYEFWARAQAIPSGQETGDKDGDGASNIDEYLAGTNPNNPSSRFRIVGNPGRLITEHENDVYLTETITFTTEPNRAYIVESSVDMKSWDQLDYLLSNTTGSLTVSIDTVYYILEDVPAGRFLRVRVIYEPGDFDGDGLSDLNEISIGTNRYNSDTDGDGLTDAFEWFYLFNPKTPSGPGEANLDTDGDGLSNLWEQKLGLNPQNLDTDGNGVLDGNEDNDSDGLTNLQEINTYHTNPREHDTDGDEQNDGWEVQNNLNPLVWNNPYEDPDGDGLQNWEEAQYGTGYLIMDTDGDGLTDAFEIQQGSNAKNAGSKTPPANGVFPFIFTFGDVSPSASEKYRVYFTPTDPSLDPVGVHYRTNLHYGVLDTFTVNLAVGATYTVKLVHISTDPSTNLSRPDYDYTLTMLPTSAGNKAVLINDLNIMLGEHWAGGFREPTAFYAKGKIVTLTVMYLRSQTEATVPTNRQRTKLGVGEDVDIDLMAANINATYGPVTWSVRGGTSRILGTTYTSTTLIAGDQAHNATVTATVRGIVLSMTFNVVPPTGVAMERWPGSNLFHIFGIPSCGMLAISRLKPYDVSFKNLWVREGRGVAVADGCYQAQNGDDHPEGEWYEVIEGTALQPSVYSAPDEISTVVAWPIRSGTFLWPIQWKYKVDFGAERNLCIMYQYFVCSDLGTVFAYKGDNPDPNKNYGEFRALFDPNSTY